MEGLPSNVSQNENKSADPSVKDITLVSIYKKLAILDRIDTKLDNLQQQVQDVEVRLSAVENDYTELCGAVDVTRADLASIQKSQQSLHKSDIMKRLEALENDLRSKNIKIFHLPDPNQETDAVLTGEVQKVLNIALHFQESSSSSTMDIQPNPDLALITSIKRLGKKVQNNSRTVLVSFSDESIVQRLLNSGNKAIRNHAKKNNLRQWVRIGDDVSLITQEKRKQLMPKMKKLRDDGLIALIPFSKTAKLIYRQAGQWHTIFPEQV